MLIGPAVGCTVFFTVEGTTLVPVRLGAVVARPPAVAGVVVPGACVARPPLVVGVAERAGVGVLAGLVVPEVVGGFGGAVVVLVPVPELVPLEDEGALVLRPPLEEPPLLRLPPELLELEPPPDGRAAA